MGFVGVTLELLIFECWNENSYYQVTPLRGFYGIFIFIFFISLFSNNIFVIWMDRNGDSWKSYEKLRRLWRL